MAALSGGWLDQSGVRVVAIDALQGDVGKMQCSQEVRLVVIHCRIH